MYTLLVTGGTLFWSVAKGGGGEADQGATGPEHTAWSGKADLEWRDSSNVYVAGAVEDPLANGTPGSH